MYLEPLKALVLLFATGGLAVPAIAGTATASFTVTGTFNRTGTCLLNPSTGALQCTTGLPPGGGGSVPELPGGPVASPATQYWLWQPNLAGYLGYQGFWLASADARLTDSYSGLLGAYSSVRMVSFAGREYLEMTVSW